MRIAILTQPLHTNYGGILQAYAVQKILKECNHEVETINLKIERPISHIPFFRQIRIFLASFIYFIIGRTEFKNIVWPFNNYTRNYGILCDCMQPFINDVMNMSPRIRSEKEFLYYISSNQFDAYVVGSDQVWRPMYSPNIGWFFLDFLSPESSVKRISISASFGTDNWEFTEEQTTKFKSLVQRFNAVSVRESSGVDMCKRYFGIDATLLLDPTMMLTQSDYAHLVEMDKENTVSVRGKLFSYLLDDSSAKRRVLKDLQKILNLPVISLNNRGHFGPYASVKTALKNGPKPVAQWLRCFQEADFVVTDSFHGTVFSILHHRQFVVVANKTRGISRIENLLNSFGLEDRFVYSGQEMSQEWLLKAIDWSNVDDILNQNREKFMDFLKHNLYN